MNKQRVDFPVGENACQGKRGTPRGRLVELLQEADKKAQEYILENDHMDWIPKTNELEEVRADYLLANGVIALPCKVGQTVYKVVNDKRVKKPYECKVVGIWYANDENANDVHLVRYVNGIFDCSFSVQFKEFGKKVFLTKEEAEAKLKGGAE